MPVAVELNGLLPGLGPGRGAPGRGPDPPAWAHPAGEHQVPGSSARTAWRPGPDPAGRDGPRGRPGAARESRPARRDAEPRAGPGPLGPGPLARPRTAEVGRGGRGPRRSGHPRGTGTRPESPGSSGRSGSRVRARAGTRATAGPAAAAGPPRREPRDGSPLAAAPSGAAARSAEPLAVPSGAVLGAGAAAAGPPPRQRGHRESGRRPRANVRPRPGASRDRAVARRSRPSRATRPGGRRPGLDP